MKRLYFTVVKCFVRKLDLTIKYQKFRHFQMSVIWLSTFEVFNRLLASLNAYISRCYNFWEKVDLTIKYQKFCHFEMFVIRLKFVDAQSLSYTMKRLYFTVVNCFVKTWFDHQISEILTFWNVCYMTQLLSKCSIVC